jgi:hypothetical protein
MALHKSGLLCHLDLEGFLATTSHVHRLDSHDTTSPSTGDFLVLVEGSLHGLNKHIKFLGVFLLYGSDGNARSGLLTDELTKLGLTFHNAKRHILLAAEGRKPHNKLNRVHVMSDENELGLFLLNKISNVVDTKLEDGKGRRRSSSLGGSHLLQTLFLLLLGLRSELLAQTHDLAKSRLIDGVLELRDRRRDLKALKEDTLLTLKANVLGPLDKASQVRSGLDVTSDTKRTGSLLENVSW